MRLLVVLLNCFINQLTVADWEQWDLCDWALQDVNFEIVRRKQWIEDKRIEEILSGSIDVSSKASVRPNHSPRCSEQPQPDQPRTRHRTWLKMLRLVAEQAPQPDKPRTHQRQWTWLRMLRLVRVIVVMIKPLNNHLSRSRTYLRVLS